MKKITLFAISLALLVIMLGAYTRLIDAGLGCPDWPGCYGQIMPVVGAAKAYPASPFVAQKAWAEMIHRYAVGALGLLIAVIVLNIFSRKKLRSRGNVILASGLLLLLAYQILLGRFTVTLKLWPIVVSQHLLGGFLILVTLWMIYLNLTQRVRSMHHKPVQPWIRLYGIFVLALLFVQIILGAWTSTNYASLSCPDFPFCMNDQMMTWHFREAFALHPAGVNYEGGILPEGVRQTIQMMHRFGALVVSVLLLGLVGLLFSRQWRCVYIIAILLPLQICLGIMNVLFELPVAVAVSHTFVAALLLLSVITLVYSAVNRYS